MSRIRGHRIKNVIMKVVKRNTITAVIAWVALRRSNSQRFPANRVDYEIEIGLGLVRRVLRNLNRVDRNGSAVDVSWLVLWLTCGRAANQDEGQDYERQTQCGRDAD